MMSVTEHVAYIPRSQKLPSGHAYTILRSRSHRSNVQTEFITEVGIVIMQFSIQRRRVVPRQITPALDDMQKDWIPRNKYHLSRGPRARSKAHAAVLIQPITVYAHAEGKFKEQRKNNFQVSTKARENYVVKHYQGLSSKHADKHCISNIARSMRGRHEKRRSYYYVASR